MVRPGGAGKNDGKAVEHHVGDAAFLHQYGYVKQIAGMLSVERSHKFACVEFISGQNWNFDVVGNRKKRLRFGAERHHFRNKQHTAVYGVDFDFDFCRTVGDDQLRETFRETAVRHRFESVRREVIVQIVQSSVDLFECLNPGCVSVDIDAVQIDRQTRQVGDEKINCGSAF